MTGADGSASDTAPPARCGDQSAGREPVSSVVEMQGRCRFKKDDDAARLFSRRSWEGEWERGKSVPSRIKPATHARGEVPTRSGRRETDNASTGARINPASALFAFLRGIRRNRSSPRESRPRRKCAPLRTSVGVPSRRQTQQQRRRRIALCLNVRCFLLTITTTTTITMIAAPTVMLPLVDWPGCGRKLSVRRG